MISMGLKKWSKEKGWQSDRNFVYGDYKGYIFTAFDRRKFKAFTTKLPNLTEEQRNNITNYIEDNKQKLKISEYFIDEDTLIVRCQELIKPLESREIDFVLDSLTNLFLKEGICGKDYCAICGIRESNQTVAINDSVSSICTDCFSQLSTDVDELGRQYDSEEKNYSTGILGAILGGLVAIVPWVLAQIYLGLYTSILGLFIGKASLKGYVLLKGKMGRATRWIILVVTLSSVVLAELIFLKYTLVQEGIQTSLENYIKCFTNPDILKWILKDLLIGLVMASLGVSSIFKNLKNEESNMAPRIKKLSL